MCGNLVYLFISLRERACRYYEIGQLLLSSHVFARWETDAERPLCNDPYPMVRPYDIKAKTTSLRRLSRNQEVLRYGLLFDEIVKTGMKMLWQIVVLGCGFDSGPVSTEGVPFHVDSSRSVVQDQFLKKHA